MDSYLVTGAMGFIGSHWCEHLLKQGKTVYGLDLGNYYPKLLEYDNFTFVQDTIKHWDVIEKLVEKVDVVCHFAGIAEPSQYVKFPRKVIDITAISGLRIIDMCRLSGKLFFLTSTSEIYGKNPNIPYKETDDRVLGATTTKRWNYSSSKAILEHYLDACAFSKELDHVIVRLFNIYGPRLRGRVASNFIEALHQGEDIFVHGDGSHTRCFTWVEDAMEAFDKVVHDPKCHNQIFNIGNPKETSIKEFADTVIDVGEFSKDKIQYITHEEAYGTSYEDCPRRVPDMSKLEEYTGLKLDTPLEVGIKKTLAYLDQQAKDVKPGVL